MRIRSAFLIGFTLVAIPGSLSSAWICVKALDAWAEARDSKYATRIVLNVQRAHTAFIVEMGSTVAAVLGSDLDLKQLPDAQKTTDKFFDQARTAVSKAGSDLDIIQATVSATRKVRLKLEEMLAQPPEQRDLREINHFLNVRSERGNELARLANDAAQRVSASSWLTSNLVRISAQVMDMREYVGQRNLVIHSWVAGQPIAVDQIIMADQLTGRIAQAWTSTQRIIANLPTLLPLQEEAKRQEKTFFERDEKRWLNVLMIARARIAAAEPLPAWPESSLQYRLWTQRAKEDMLGLRDTAMTEAVNVVLGEEHWSKLQFALAALLALVTVLASITSIILLLRRIVSPVLTLTSAISQIANHDFAAQLPTETRMEEIKSMTVALEALRQDAIASEQSKQQITYLAQHDALTGLPNRFALQHGLEAAIERTKSGFSSAVLCLDLNRFKAVNDTYGHQAGDQVLCIVAERLLGCVRKGDIVGRFGGDEFVIILLDIGASEEAANVARRVVEAIRQPMVLEVATLDLGASVGIALTPEDGDTTRSLLMCADNALYQAKRENPGSWRFSTPKMESLTEEQSAKDRRVHAA